MGIPHYRYFTCFLLCIASTYKVFKRDFTSLEKVTVENNVTYHFKKILQKPLKIFVLCIKNIYYFNKNYANKTVQFILYLIF